MTVQCWLNVQYWLNAQYWPNAQYTLFAYIGSHCRIEHPHGITLWHRVSASPTHLAPLPLSKIIGYDQSDPGPDDGQNVAYLV